MVSRSTRYPTGYESATLWPVSFLRFAYRDRDFRGSGEVPSPPPSPSQFARRCRSASNSLCKRPAIAYILVLNVKGNLMLSYHSDPAIKARYLARIEAHADADEIIKGKYW